MDFIIQNFNEFLTFTGFANASAGNLIMILVGALFIWLAIKKDFEPLLLVPIGLGIILGNIPFRADGKDIQARHRFNRQRQSQYPPVQEKQHEPGGECRPDFTPSNFLSLDTFRSQARQRKQQDGKQLRVQHGMEQPRRAVEVQKDFVHHTDVHAPQPDGFVAEPVHVHDH